MPAVRHGRAGCARLCRQAASAWRRAVAAPSPRSARRRRPQRAAAAAASPRHNDAAAAPPPPLPDPGALNRNATLMTPDLYRYLLANTREPQVLRELREETAALRGAHMQTAPEQGALLALLVELTGATRAIEVGVYTGYSSLAVALALPPEGRLAALDRDAGTMAVAERFWERAGVRHKVEARLGPAGETLAALLQRDGPDSYDFAYIDADKAGYCNYYEHCLRLVRPGGLIAADNTLFYGRPADPERTDNATRGVRAFNALVTADARVSACMLPVADGLTLCRKR